MYKITWEMVSTVEMYRYSNADTITHVDTIQVVSNSEIPDEHWHKVQRETDDPWDQYRKLKEWDASGMGFVRNVKLYKQRSQPVWDEMTE